MTFSLDPNRNPIVRLYELLDLPGVVPKDAKRLGVENLDLRQLDFEPARELIRFLRRTLAADLGTCRLMHDGAELVNFAAGSATEWFRWEPLADRGLLREGSLVQRLRSNLDLLAQNAYWPPGRDPEEDCLAALEEIAAGSPGPPLTLEISVGKEKLVQRHLLAPLGDAASEVSAFVWRRPSAMSAAFEGGFPDFLDRFAAAAERPVVLFFHQETEPLDLDFLKILPLDGTAPVGDREAALAESLRQLGQRTRAEYRSLRRRYRVELRSDVGQNLHLPPALFLRRELAGDQSHPLLAEGPLRSLFLYALLAWLARQTEARDQKIFFDLPGVDEADLDFTMSDVLRAGEELFSTAQAGWQDKLLMLAHDVHRSAGSEDLRRLWRQATEETLSTDGLRADRFFDQLEALRQRFHELEREPRLQGLAPGKSVPDEDESVLVQLRVFLNVLPASPKNPTSRELEFELDCEPLGWFLQQVGKTSDEKFEYQEMSKLAAEEWQRLLSRVTALDKLESRGRTLWRKLIPGGLRTAYYHRIRQQEDLTLLIVSSDPSFPWELVCPHSVAEDYTDSYSELWLAGRYRLARWLAGSPPPVAQIGFERVCCVADGTLASARKEVDYFRKAGVVLRCPQNLEQLTKALKREDFDVLHFSCHGVFDKDDPADSVVLLPAGQELRPDELNLDQITTRLRRSRPLVFLNCCHSGRTGPDLTGLGGWAASLINLGCGAVIGCGWAVVDALAWRFSLAFYDSWRAGNDLSGAVLDGRHAAKEAASSNPTWLAYYLFGNPYCTLR